MVKDILDVARSLFDRRDAIIKDKKEKCDQLAKYFEGIADTLQQLADSIRVNQLAKGKIAQLSTYADLLPRTVGSDLKLMDMEELTGKLRRSYTMSSLRSEVKKDRQRVISQIEEASGVFKALGASCRIHY
jgi:hypothetical protein